RTTFAEFAFRRARLAGDARGRLLRLGRRGRAQHRTSFRGRSGGDSPAVFSVIRECRRDLALLPSRGGQTSPQVIRRPIGRDLEGAQGNGPGPHPPTYGDRGPGLGAR